MTTPLFPGKTPYLYLHDLNNLGHAVGVQGWQAWEPLAVPIFYDGTTVRQIGNPVFRAAGIDITNNDRMSVWYDSTPDYEFNPVEGIYDAAMNTVTPFSKGHIMAHNARQWIVWESRLPSVSYYLAGRSGVEESAQAPPPWLP